MEWDSTGRPSYPTYWMMMARTAALRADCTRAQFGCVIVDTHNRLCSTGYNGSPPKGPSCLKGECPRGTQTFEETPSFRQGNHDYSDCVSLHAETNAIVWADKARCRGAIMYLHGGYPPCDMCWKMIRAAEIFAVVWGTPENYEMELAESYPNPMDNDNSEVINV